MSWGTCMVVNMVATDCPARRIVFMSSRAAVGHWRAKGMEEMNATSGIKSWAHSLAEPSSASRTWVFAMCAHSSDTVRKVGTNLFCFFFRLRTQYTNLPSEYWMRLLRHPHALLTQRLCLTGGCAPFASRAKRACSRDFDDLRCMHPHLRAMMGQFPSESCSLEKGGSISLCGFS